MIKPKISNFNIRLTLYYSLIFIFSSAVMMVFVYLFLSNELNRQHSEEIQHRLLEYWAQYESGGIALIESEFALEKKYQKTYNILLRITNSQNRTLFLSRSDKLLSFDLSPLFSLSPEIKKNILLRSPGSQFDIDVRTIEIEPHIFMQVGVSNEMKKQFIDVIQRSILFFIIPFLFIGFVGGYIIASRLLSPIKKLISTVTSIKQTGDVSTRIEASGSGDELDTLIRLFNGMLDRIGSLIKVMHDTLDNVAHDLKTPLTRIRGIAEDAIHRRSSPQKKRKALLLCIEQSDIVLRMLNTIMDISEAEAGVLALTRTNVDLRYMMDQLLELYTYLGEEKNITISADIKNDVILFADPVRLRQAIGNLIDNAIKYTEPGGHITIAVFEEKHSVVIQVADTGIGIPQEEIGHIWKRLYRIDKSRSDAGLGLGLSIVKAVITAHGGSIEVNSIPGKGSVFSISLPSMDSSSQ